ncbi:MAG TPA: M20/M25/M40 family metallo-hydrolase [Solirubrobacterales bacterium]|nr:M20/M25/M40 family metallo-hydrolase [Solirubrobacterales bacterium]
MTVGQGRHQSDRQEGAPSGARIAALMPAITADLVRLAKIPSISFPGFPREPVLEAHDLVVGMLKDAGVGRLETLGLPDTAPVITGEIPAPAGAPTVLLYAHYDVQPAGDEALWRTPPFEPTEAGGAIHGRGVADDKANVMMHVGALRAWEGRPPVGIKIVFEGQEEVGSALDTYPPRNPDPFRADALVIGDAGNVRPGEPTFNVSARGDAEVLVEVRTLAGPKHSGDFGGAAPDALLALVAALATLHTESGDVAVAGLRREPWEGESYDEEEFRRLAEVAPGVPLIGSGTLGERLWSGPAITVIGIDAPDVETAVNAVVPHARAKLNLRIHPRQSAAEARAALVAHLEAVRPFGIELEVGTFGDVGQGFAARTDGVAYRAAGRALADAWGRDPVEFALGGSIPFVSALQQALPEAEILLFGAQDGECNLHAPNERVLLDELERAVLAEARFFDRYAHEWEAKG